MMEREAAEEFASWFRCLADGTRVQILSYVADAAEPVTVGEIVSVIGKSQSTVSRHLQLLADDRFVFLEPDGVRTLVRVNRLCMPALPEAAAAIMATSRGFLILGKLATRRVLGVFLAYVFGVALTGGILAQALLG